LQAGGHEFDSRCLHQRLVLRVETGLEETMHLENCIRKKKTEKIEDKEKQKKRSCTKKYDWLWPGTQEKRKS
jgi:hypothetical protein